MWGLIEKQQQVEYVCFMAVLNHKMEHQKVVCYIQPVLHNVICLIVKCYCDLFSGAVKKQVEKL